MGRAGRKGWGEQQLPNGSWRITISVSVGGSRERVTKVFARLDEAREWARQNCGAKIAASGTVGEWLTQWLAIHQAEVRPNTMRGDRQTVEMHLRPRLGGVRLLSLTPLVVKKLFATMKKEGVTAGEVHKAGRVLRNAMNSAVALERIAKSPLSGVKIPPKPKAETQTLTLTQAQQLIQAADVFGDQASAYFRVALDAGMRPEEILGLKWKWVDLDAKTIRVREVLCLLTNTIHPPKTKKSLRTITISDATVEALKKLPQSTEFVFPSPEGKPWWYGNWRKKLFDKVSKGANVACTPYLLRHTMGSILLEAGVNIKIVSERLGHTSVGFTLDTYVHCMPDDQGKAADAIGRLFHTLSTQPKPEST